MGKDQKSDLGQRIDAIESGYEFMLAYAAQGRKTDKGGGQGQEVRRFLGDMDTALQGLGAVCTAAAKARHADAWTSCQDFLEAVEDDARKARGVINLVMSCPDISSQLVDNMNTNVHLRALLTDLFVIDEALK